MFRLCKATTIPLKKYVIRETCRSYIVTQNLYSTKEILSNPVPNLPSSSNYVKEKFNDLVVWYEQLTGMDEVRMMQNRVIEAQDRFVAAQENRRDVGKELARMQCKLKEIYSELDTTSREEERYLLLITQEHAILKDEKRLVTEFALLEREERESFNLLSASVKESHEKERAQAEKTKYWSIIGLIIGTVIGVAGSSINNEFKMRNLRKLVRESALRNTAATQRHDGQLVTIPQDMESMIIQQQQEMRILAVAVTIMGVIVPIIVTLLYRP